jgi:hypothetical protein
VVARSLSTASHLFSAQRKADKESSGAIAFLPKAGVLDSLGP